MHIDLIDIAANKTTDPDQLADLHSLRLCVLRVAAVERPDVADQANIRGTECTAKSEKVDQQVYVLQSRFCQRASSATEAIESIVGFERDELDFLSLLAELADQNEKTAMQDLIVSKQRLVEGLESFVENWG